MASRLLAGKILLIFVLPAILSLHVSATEYDEGVLLSWLRYWVVLSTGLVVEYLLEKLEGVTLTSVKIVVVLWCLAPVEYNGSDVLYNYVLLPTHTGIHYVIIETSNVATPALQYTKDLALEGVEYTMIGMELVVDRVIYPSMDILTSAMSTAVSAVSSFLVYSYHLIGDITQIWFQKMLPPINCAMAIFQHIGYNIAEGFVTGLEKLVEMAGKTPEFATACYHSFVEYSTILLNKVYEVSVISGHKIAELSVFVFDCLVALTIFASEKSVEWSIAGGEAVIATLEDGVSYYKKNQENPRLFSVALKQMIH